MSLNKLHPIAVLISLVICISLPVATFPQVCSGCEVSQQTVTKANNRLNLDDILKADAEARHFLGGRPFAPAGATNERMIHQIEWITWYDDYPRVPLWVAYKLTGAEASAQLTRKDCFRNDPRLSDAVASKCEDYQEPIFDHGHMIPNADLKRARLAHMVAQQDRFNFEIWARLESKVRAWAKVADGVSISI